MATAQASSTIFSHRRIDVRATMSAPNFRLSLNHLSLPKLPTNTHLEKESSPNISFTNNSTRLRVDAPDSGVISKLYEMMEAVADRVEMHKNIGEQRNNWNQLLLSSINAITLTASLMTGIAATSGVNGSGFLALKLSSTILYGAATGMLVMMNTIQPSQLAEEQRNAARLFKQLHGELQTVVALGNPTVVDVNEALEKVLALDKAFPLPLLGKMIEKFPSSVKPAVWWPQQRRKQWLEGKINGNGWSSKLEEEMRNIVEVLKRKDLDDYSRLGNKALKLNKMLAISGPLLTGLAAIGSTFVGNSSPLGSLGVMLGVIGGAMASVINTFEHGGQVGMVFEMYRSNAGFFKLMEETIESNIGERDVERRENGELLEMKVALQLGRSLSELRILAASSSSNGTEATEEFASKLF
ncbi:hypothetical protein Patl1_09975 [Pistacia atlantica]|uniref:Uncharacterized protein n=1 Tax=Pistacia atlantica TaxID=434234 RepID=A0ACC1A6T4_9ROSI|nr:hypothetical protein Patl1_09975 [Pistacia atlantica]